MHNLENVVTMLTRVRLLRAAMAILAGLALSACSGELSGDGGRIGLGERVVNFGSPVPKGGGSYKVGSPYQVANVWFQPRENMTYDRVGTASWYGDLFHGRRTANGEIFDMDALTAAHPTLPMPVLVEVTNLENQRRIVVRVNDRGPFKSNRVIDLSRKAAKLLGFHHKGTAKVRVRYLRNAPLDGDDGLEQRVATNAERQQTVDTPIRHPDTVAQGGGAYAIGLHESRAVEPRQVTTSGRRRDSAFDEDSLLGLTR